MTEEQKEQIRQLLITIDVRNESTLAACFEQKHWEAVEDQITTAAIKFRYGVSVIERFRPPESYEATHERIMLNLAECVLHIPMGTSEKRDKERMEYWLRKAEEQLSKLRRLEGQHYQEENDHEG